MPDGGSPFLLPIPRTAPPPPRDGVIVPQAPSVVWKPLPGSQELALSCPCNEILYEGSRGPGKTDAQLMMFRRFVGIGYGQHWRGVIFDREYKNLDDLISKSLRWFTQFGDGARFLSSRADYRWVWPTGEELLFRQIKRTQDYWKYHGQEFPFMGWNELTKFPSPDLFDTMKSCNRTSYVAGENPIWYDGDPNPHFLPELPLIIFATTNPYGAGHTWVKHRMIDIAEPGQIVRRSVYVFNPRTQQREEITRTFVRIFGSYKENKYLPPEYIAMLEEMQDPNKRRAWLWGDWDIVAGGAFSDLWGQHLIKPRFRIPESWKIDRSFDWGSSHPFSVGWWAEASGEEARLPDGSTFCPPPGSLVRLHEWYGSEAIGSNKGLLMSCTSIAEEIKKIESLLLEKGWIQSKVRPGPADNQIGEIRESDLPSIKTRMASKGVVWTDSDKRAGSRKQGVELMRERMLNAKKGEGPGIFFMSHCRAAISTIPVLPRDEDEPDDVDTDAEDHVWDETRYRILAVRRHAKVSPLAVHK